MPKASSKGSLLNVYHSSEAMSIITEAQDIVSAAIDPIIGILAKDRHRSSRSRSRSRSRERRRPKSRSRSRSHSRGRRCPRSRSITRSRSRSRRSRSREQLGSRSKYLRLRRRCRSRSCSRRSHSRDRHKRSRSRRRSISRGPRGKRSGSRHYKRFHHKDHCNYSAESRKSKIRKQPVVLVFSYGAEERIGKSGRGDDRRKSV